MSSLHDIRTWPVCVCGHSAEEHSDGGPAHTGYTRCEYNVSDYGASGCDKNCLEYLPDQDKCEHEFAEISPPFRSYCYQCDIDRDEYLKAERCKEHDAIIDMHRARLEKFLTEAAENLQRALGEIRELGSDHLYDVEYVEGDNRVQHFVSQAYFSAVAASALAEKINRT